MTTVADLLFVTVVCGCAYIATVGPRPNRGWFPGGDEDEPEPAPEESK